MEASPISRDSGFYSWFSNPSFRNRFSLPDSAGRPNDSLENYFAFPNPSVGGPRRSQFETLVNVLQAISEGETRRTWVMYRANLSSNVLGRYLRFVLDKGLITKEGKLIRISERGIEFLSLYRSMLSIIQTAASKS